MEISFQRGIIIQERKRVSVLDESVPTVPSVPLHEYILVLPPCRKKRLNVSFAAANRQGEGSGRQEVPPSGFGATREVISWIAV